MASTANVETPPSSTLSKVEADLRLRRLETAVRYLYTNSLPVPVIIVGFCLLLGQSQPFVDLFVWGAVTIALWVSTTLTVRAFLKDERRAERTTRWTVAICVVLFFACSALASVSVFFWVDGDRLNNVLLYVLVAAGLAGAGAQSAPSTPVVVTNMTPYAVLFLSLSLGREAYPINLGIAFLQVCYIVLVALTARAVWQLSDEMLRLRSEKRLLIDQLQASLIETTAAQHKAEAASKAKSEFLANMSHELRTPLNAVLGFSEIIKERTFGQDGTGRYEEYAGHIHYSGRHLLGLIGDILDLSKIEAGKRELDESEFDLVRNANESLRFVAPQAEMKKLAMTLDAPRSVAVCADERAISQITINLLSNAVKFTPEGGRVTLSVFVNAAGGATIAVSDTGIGIAADELEKVMERFGQARHDVVTTPERGTGLGLPIVKGLVELHGGVVRVESELGMGTTVTVQLPAARVRDLGQDLATNAA
jgi:two-component system cell cycle sensor histidine kinase PleC